MSIYENKFAKVISNITEKLIPVNVQQHIEMITDASPTSHYYCKIEDKEPTMNIYLIEQNKDELYILCHFFSYDNIGDDYQYQSLPLKQIKAFEDFASKSSIIF